MTDLVLFAGFLILGGLVNLRGAPPSWHGRIRNASSTVLLLFIGLMFGEMAFPRDNLLLVAMGALMQAVPALIGMMIGPKGDGPAFLLFSTYGGGNRGTLAITLLAPSLLPDFMLMDLGILLSLLLLFQLAARRYSQAGSSNKPALRYFLLTVTAILCGIALRQGAGPSPALRELFGGVKGLMVALTSLQIGLNLRISRQSLAWVLSGLWKVRLSALVVPALLLTLMDGDSRNRIIPLLGLFAVLPVSSLAVSLLPDRADGALQEKLSTALVGSSAFYILAVAGLEGLSLLLHSTQPL